MKTALRALVVMFALTTLAACASLSPTEKSILRGGESIVSETSRPITNNQMLVLEATYRTAIVAAVTYRRQGLCKRGQHWTVEKPCAERQVLVVIQRYFPAARSAMASLRRYRAAGDTTNALRTFAAAKAAIAQVQNELFLAGVK